MNVKAKTKGATFSYDVLRNLCIRNSWFTDGTNEQYDKLFFLNSIGTDLVTLTTLIWFCSDGVSIMDVYNALCEAKD